MADRQPTRPVVPGRSERGAYVYVLRFTSGIVKVGRTANPANRLAVHEKNARVHGSTVEAFWISPPHRNEAASEAALIGFCQQRAASVFGAEYFAGVDFEHVVKHAKGLAYTPISEEDRRRRSEEAKNRPPLFGDATLPTAAPVPSSAWWEPESIMLLEHALRLPPGDLNQIADEDRDEVAGMADRYFEALQAVHALEAKLVGARKALAEAKAERTLTCNYLYAKLDIVGGPVQPAA